MTLSIDISYDVLPVDPMELPERLRPAIEAAHDEADELRAAGAFRLITPRELGSFEMSLLSVLRVLEDLGRIDGPVAWTVWNGNIGLVAAMLPASGVAKIWADGPDPVIVNSARPAATARPVEGGFELAGRWDLVSGLDSSEWACLFALVFDGDAPALTSAGQPDLRLFLVPRKDMAIEDTWQVTAMRGSGSNTAVLDRAFVPADLVGTLHEAMSLANEVSRAALVAIHEVAGSSVLYSRHRLEHVVRDGLAATQHGNLAAAHYALAGRIQLGLDPQDLVF